MKRCTSFVCLGAALGLATGGLVAPALADTTLDHTEWISDDGGSAGRELPVMSANGQYVVFVARSSAYQGVWIKDRLQPAKPAWQLWAGAAFNPAISADGSTVAWAKYGTGEGGQSILLLRWKQTSEPVEASLSDTGRPAGAPTDFPSLSGNGNLVAFQSMDADLDDDVVPDREGGGPTKVYVRDLAAGETEMVSVVDRDGGDKAVNGNALKPDITSDGRYVAFASDASVLQGDDEESGGGEVSATAEETSFQQVYVRDRQAMTTLPVSALGSADALVFGDGAAATSYGPSISDDGKLVAFESDATNLVEGDTNGDTDAFVKNMTSGAIVRVSVLADGSEADILADGTTEEPVVTAAAAPIDPGSGQGGGGGDSTPDVTPNVGLGPVLSGDGQFVAFESKAALTSDDQNGGMATCTDTAGTTTEYVEPADVYKFKMSDRTLVRESAVVNEDALQEGGVLVEATGYRIDGESGLCVPVNNGVDAAISANGSKVAFVSNGNLVGRVVEEEDTHETEPAASLTEVTAVEDLVENVGIEPSVYLHHPAGDTTSPDIPPPPPPPPPSGGGGGTTPPPDDGGVTPPPVPSEDELAPESRATSPKLSRKLTFPVTYTAQDDGGSGVASVALFAKAPGQTAFSKVATDTGAAVDGKFRYTAATQGVVELYTAATDEAGNVEAAPAVADTATRVDTTAPTIRRRMGPGPYAFDIGDQRRLEIRYRVNERVRTRFLIRQAGEVVKRGKLSVEPRGLVTKYWLGKTAGEVVPSGRYVLVIKARDMAGNPATVRAGLRVTR